MLTVFAPVSYTLEECTMFTRCLAWRPITVMSGLVTGLALGLSAEISPLVGFRVGLTPTFAQAVPSATEIEALPDRKTVTVIVEGEPQVVTMQLYERPGIPLVTYYPPAMTTTEACDEEGCFVSFAYDDLGAAVFFLIPAEAEVASQAEPYITGENGLLAGSGWSITGEYTSEAALRYPWAKKLITFQAADMQFIGAATLGEMDGQGFAAIEVLPPDAGDGFSPQANAILSEVRMQ
jgi:hypothetical protein